MEPENREVERRNRLEESEQKFEYEVVEALPLLGLIASMLFIAIFMYMAHA